MVIRYNPFRPNSPVYTGMFAGRIKEIDRIDELLYQAKLANPANILIIGERGIGKSSLLLVANHSSKGTLTWAENKHNFLTIQVSLSADTTMIDLATKLNAGIIRELNKSEQGLAFIKKSWDFLQRWEVGGIKYKQEKHDSSMSELIDNLSFSIADTVKAVTKSNASTGLCMREQKDEATGSGLFC